jgi:DNA-binding NarL/FixJ family response regulator
MIKILIADDQELIRQSMEIVLRTRKDFQITGAVQNGREVIAAVRKDMPDVILMDIRMPELDGVQCTEIIKENHPDIKIIILTTFDDDEYVFSAFKYGASGYLLKGISFDELENAIRTVVDGGTLINPDVASKIVKHFSLAAQKERYTHIHVDKSAVDELIENEWRIIQLIGRGKSNKEIAIQLAFSEGTVRNYISSILSKLNLRDRTQLAIWAVETNTISMEDEL